MQYVGAMTSIGGAALTLSGLSKYGASTSTDDDKEAGRTTLLGSGLSVAGSAISGAATGAKYGSAAGLKGIAIGAVLGGIVGLVSNLSSIISGVDMMSANLSRRLELANKTLTAS